MSENINAMGWSHLLCHTRKSPEIGPKPFHTFTIRQTNSNTPQWTVVHLKKKHELLLFSGIIIILDKKRCVHRNEMMGQRGLNSPATADQLSERKWNSVM